MIYVIVNTHSQFECWLRHKITNLWSFESLINEIDNWWYDVLGETKRMIYDFTFKSSEISRNLIGKRPKFWVSIDRDTQTQIRVVIYKIINLWCQIDGLAETKRMIHHLTHELSEIDQNWLGKRMKLSNHMQITWSFSP